MGRPRRVEVIEKLDRLTEGSRWQRALSVYGYALLGGLIIVLPFYVLIFLLMIIAG